HQGSEHRACRQFESGSMNKDPDWNDLHRTAGPDAVREQFDAEHKRANQRRKKEAKRTNGPDDDKPFGEIIPTARTKSPREEPPPVDNPDQYGFDSEQASENEPECKSLPWIDMSNWDNEPVPKRKWVIENRVPLNQAGLSSGEGGTG